MWTTEPQPERAAGRDPGRGPGGLSRKRGPGAWPLPPHLSHLRRWRARRRCRRRATADIPVTQVRREVRDVRNGPSKKTVEENDVKGQFSLAYCGKREHLQKT